jgi:hypothetical protein
VRVGSPYLAECVSGGTPAANDRVKKVVRHWTGHKIVLFWEIWVEKENDLFMYAPLQLELERKRLQARGASRWRFYFSSRDCLGSTLWNGLLWVPTGLRYSHLWEKHNSIS